MQRISGDCLNIDSEVRGLGMYGRNCRIDRVIRDGKSILWEVTVPFVMRKDISNSEWLPI
jgi:hypothetical protein